MSFRDDDRFRLCKRHPPPFLAQRVRQLAEQNRYHEHSMVPLYAACHSLHCEDELVMLQRYLLANEIACFNTMEQVTYIGEDGECLVVWEISNSTNNARWIHTEGWSLGSAVDVFFLYDPVTRRWWRANLEDMESDTDTPNWTDDEDEHEWTDDEDEMAGPA